MDAESINITEDFEHNVQNNGSEAEVTTINTAYSQNETVDSYTHFETHESSSEALPNNELSSHNAVGYNTEISECYTENIGTETVVIEDTKDTIENEGSEQPQINEDDNIRMETSQDEYKMNENVENDYVAEYKVGETQTENASNENDLPDSDIIVEEPTENAEENAQNVEESIDHKIGEGLSSEVTVEEIDNTDYAEAMDTQENDNVVVTEVDDSMHFESVRTEESITEDNKAETSSEVIEDGEKSDENIKENSFDLSKEPSNVPEGDLVIEEVETEEIEVNQDQQQETVVYEESPAKCKDENIQSIEDDKNAVEETHNKEAVESETVIYDSDQIDAQQITIIESHDSLEFEPNTIIEEVGMEQSFSEDLNSSVTDSFSHDDSPDLIIIQDVDSEEQPDDPLPPPQVQKPAQDVANKPRRKGRKATFDIPMHVLGHDINKPLEPVVNGRAIPKPRLGVKVPYRNLTSQIVSKAEIEKEIMERGRAKMEQNKDQKFARSLTQRLVKKIVPTADAKETNILSIMEQKEDNLKVKVEKKPASTSIQNDSDLLAILEGDGDESDMPVVHKEPSSSPQVDESNLKALEREIALQQLSELPHQTPRQRVFRGKTSKPVMSTGNTVKDKPTTPNNQEHLSKEKNKENSTKSSTPHSRKEQVDASPRKQPVDASPRKQPVDASPRKQSIDASPRKPPIDVSPRKHSIDVSPKKQPVEIEPQVKVNMVLKTYSRKRRISEPQDPLKDYPPPKKPVYDDSPDDVETIELKTEPVETVQQQPPSPVYVTKSSRVIKKKVIWDPDDDVSTRSPKPAPKQAATDNKSVVQRSSPAVKTVKTDRNSNNEKVVEKKVPEKKTQEKKVVEKTPSEKKVEKTPPKKSSSPKSNSGSKPKKLRSEIDRLLMDEGAVKMLYELNNTDENAPKKKKEFYSVERAQKEIIKKANLLKNELEQTTTNDSQISLRKKEGLIVASVTPSPTRSGPILERKMSKDSTKSSVHTPPASPFQHTQSSMLIRRRSSSSLSSSDDMEIEFKPREIRRKSDTPKAKKAKKSEESEVDESQRLKKQIKVAVVEIKLNQYKAFTLKKTGRHVSIDLNYIDEKCYFTMQVLEELTAVLKKFSKDKDCNIVTITSSSRAFCLGLDYPSLVEEDEETRMELAIALSDRVKDFLFCLLHFPKVLVACIQGDCVGLGVTMLPLFDIVVASDSATFTTPYARLGCMGEAAFLLSYPNLVSHLLASEMIFTGQKITADEAFRRGLISKLCWPEKYKETMKSLVISVAKASKQSLEASKKQLRTNRVREIEAAINSERKIWIEHWTSPECQEKFSLIGNE